MRTTPFDLNAIAAFVEVVDRGGFREASRVLDVPKSTLSQRVAALEERLGAKLLVRTTRSVKLTEMGERYHREVAPAAASMRAAEGVIGELCGRPSGRLRMTAAFELGQRLLGPVLAAYTTAHPSVIVEVDLTDRIVDLVEEGYDLAIRIGSLEDSNLVARRLGTPQRMGVFGSPAYLARAGTPEVPNDLLKHRCLVMHGARSPTRWLFQGPRKTRAIAVKPHLTVNSYDVLQTLVTAGVGLARLPGATTARAPGLVEVLSSYAMPAVPVHAVYPRARGAVPAVRAMVDLLAERIDLSVTPPIPSMPVARRR